MSNIVPLIRKAKMHYDELTFCVTWLRKDRVGGIVSLELEATLNLG